MPHYLRFVSALALVASSAGCARVVGPLDGLEPEAGAAAGCPAEIPRAEACPAAMTCRFPYGAQLPCEVTTCTCGPGDGGGLQWRCQPGCIVGPLPPPELPG